MGAAYLMSGHKLPAKPVLETKIVAGEYRAETGMLFWKKQKIRTGSLERDWTLVTVLSR